MRSTNYSNPKIDRRLQKLSSGVNQTKLPISRPLRRETVSSPLFQMTSSQEQEKTGVDLWSKSFSIVRPRPTLLTVEEPEIGAAAEGVTPPVLLKVATEAEVRAIVKEAAVDAEAVEDREEEEVNVVEAVAVDVEVSTRPKDHQQQHQQPQPPATLDFRSCIVVVLHQKPTFLVHLLNGHYL